MTVVGALLLKNPPTGYKPSGWTAGAGLEGGGYDP
jgi:hypothetical protein